MVGHYFSARPSTLLQLSDPVIALDVDLLCALKLDQVLRTRARRDSVEAAAALFGGPADAGNSIDFRDLPGEVRAADAARFAQGPKEMARKRRVGPDGVEYTEEWV
jgi:hypothetical protein